MHNTWMNNKGNHFVDHKSITLAIHYTIISPIIEICHCSLTWVSSRIRE
jgi:hypothetical protein